MTINIVHHKNENFFSVPNEKNSYWAGFIAADGCITTKRRALCIRLSSKDIKHLKLFKQHIEFQGKLSEYNYNSYNCCQLQIINEKIVNDLNKIFNISDNKTWTLEPPPINNDAEIISYIRGYIDGDGSISFDKINRKWISIVSGSTKILNWINFHCCRFLNIPLKNINNHKNIFQLTFAGREALNLYKILYTKNNLSLKRKWKFSLRKIDKMLNRKSTHWKIEKDFLIKNYVNEEKSQRQISKDLGCSAWKVDSYLKKYEIPIRTEITQKERDRLQSYNKLRSLKCKK